jgi:hypothetical protein
MQDTRLSSELPLMNARPLCALPAALAGRLPGLRPSASESPSEPSEGRSPVDCGDAPAGCRAHACNPGSDCAPAPQRVSGWT